MPVYEYTCIDCGQVYDILHVGREALEDIVCPHCGSTRHKKLISAPTIAAKATRPGDASCDNGNCCGGFCDMD